MNVCFVAHASKLEGADRSLLETIRLLRAEGVSPHVIVPRSGRFVEELEREAIPYTVWPHYWWIGRKSEALHLRFARYGALLLTWLGSPLLARRVRQLPFDLVYSNTIASPLGMLLARWLNLPHVCHIREFVDVDHQMDFLLGKVRTMRMLDNNSAALLANSRAVGRAFTPPLKRNTPIVAYQAVALGPSPLPTPESADLPLRLLLVGRLHPGKGQETAIEALRLLTEQGTEAELVLLGSGKPDYEAHLRTTIEAKGLGAKVRMEGTVNDPAQHFVDCDVALMCSQNEAFGRVTIEAMKYGRPVIGARSGGTEELIAEGQTGWLFTPGDPVDLARAITVATTERSELDAMGRRAQAWANNTFSETAYSDLVLQALRAAIGETSGRTSRTS
ncbi:MAG: glycosyltransferase family 4 protein [Trueperaceae bacterium]